MSPRRATSGGLIDRSRSVRFSFDGQDFAGHPGDTLASALLANGVSLFGRSFKYHRPRGVLAAGVDEPNALVTVLRGEAREPNIQATMLEIYDGLKVVSQNRFPSLGFDVGAVNQLGGKLLGAGFYYKTFMGPVFGPLKGTRFWMFCEHFIRRAAGLGSAGTTADPSRYERMNAFCDMLVVGSGPAGLMAAKAAAASGERVMLAEQDARIGGSANWSGENIDEMSCSDWAAAVVRELAALPNVTLLPRTTVWGYYDGNTIAALERVADHKASARAGEPRHRHWTIRAGKVVLATGAFERPLVFPGNDRPGVMLASAAERYAVEYGVLPGEKVAVFANNDGAYRSALALREAGCRIVAIVDVRRGAVGKLRVTLAVRTGAEILAGRAVTGTEGGKALSGIKVQGFRRWRQARRAAIRARSRPIACWCPAAGRRSSTSPARPARRAEWSDRLQAFLPPKEADGWIGAGGFNGTFSLAAALAEGGGGGGSGGDDIPEVSGDELDIAPAPVFEIEAAGKAFVDFQHDVTADDVRLAHREGFCLGRAPEALHHARHGDRPGQDFERAGPRHHGERARQADPGSRHDAFPPALRAGDDRRAGGRALRRDQARAADADVRLACRPRRDDVFRRPLAPLDDLWPAGRVGRTGLCARGEDDARGRRHRRRLDARQDRGAGAGRRGFPRPRLHQHLLDAAGRQGALRADAARGRAGARRRHDLAARRAGFPDDHDDGQRRQGHAASRISARRDLARPQGATHLGDRPVGGRVDRRAEGAGNPGRLRHRAPRSTTRRCPSWASSTARYQARR